MEEETHEKGLWWLRGERHELRVGLWVRCLWRQSWSVATARYETIRLSACPSVDLLIHLSTHAS
eukprot:342579-Pelagomonas_calceolata.AAC.3